MKNLLNLIFVILFFGCNSENGKIIHPTTENIPDLNLENVRVTNTGSNHFEIDSITKHLNTIEVQEVISENEGEYSNLFGFITDIVIDSYNRIYILDERRQDISIFNDEGKFLKKIGGKGAGPGETESAKSLSIYNDERLLVSNFNRIEVFKIKENDIEFYNSENFEKPVNNLCIIGDTLFTYSPIVISKYRDSEKNYFPIIHAYSMPEMKFLFSFGESYKSEKLPIVSQLSFGEMSCNENTSTVIFEFDRFPFLYGYSSKNGSLKWVNIFDELQMPIIEESMRGGQIGIGFNSSENKFRDSILRTKTLLDNYQLVQVDRRLIPEENSYVSESEVMSFIIDANTGKSIYLGKEIPRILGSSKDLLIGVNSDYVQALLLK